MRPLPEKIMQEIKTTLQLLAKVKGIDLTARGYTPEEAKTPITVWENRGQWYADTSWRSELVLTQAFWAPTNYEAMRLRAATA
jgi:hypothetical protein